MADDPLVLGFDTSGPWIGVALLRGDKVVAERHQDMAKGQAEQLFCVLESLLHKAGATWQDLNAVGVGVGPGNFTGIRISVSAARGLALSLDIPVVGVSLLEACAWGQSRPTLATVQAPNNHAYVQGFGTTVEIAPSLVALDDGLAKWCEPGLVCVGTACDIVVARGVAKRAWAVYEPGVAIARIAAERMDHHPPLPVPMYLRAADAAPSRDAAPMILNDA